MRVNIQLQSVAFSLNELTPAGGYNASVGVSLQAYSAENAQFLNFGFPLPVTQVNTATDSAREALQQISQMADALKAEAERQLAAIPPAAPEPQPNPRLPLQPLSPR